MCDSRDTANCKLVPWESLTFQKRFPDACTSQLGNVRYMYNIYYALGYSYDHKTISYWSLCNMYKEHVPVREHHVQ